MAEYQDFTSSLTGEEIEARLLAVPNKVDKVEGKGLSKNDYTDAEKEKLAGAYTKPSSGIPSTDLATGVQTSLSKADTALQQSAIEQAPTEETGQELLTEEELNTLYTEYFLKTLDRIFSEFPQDKSLSGIVDELVEENSWLDQLYREVAAAKT